MSPENCPVENYLQQNFLHYNNLFTNYKNLIGISNCTFLHLKIGITRAYLPPKAKGFSVQNCNNFDTNTIRSIPVTMRKRCDFVAESRRDSYKVDTFS